MRPRTIRPVLLWLVDDSPHHHAVAAATVARVSGVRLAGFLTAHDAIAAFAKAARAKAATAVPDVVLMDFFLGDGHGDQVTRRFRQLEPRAKRPVIIGYSSVRSGSEAIVAAGGDLVLRKTGDTEHGNPELLEWLEETRP